MMSGKMKVALDKLKPLFIIEEEVEVSLLI
jgi:hypothetical protein